MISLERKSAKSPTACVNGLEDSFVFTDIPTGDPAI